MLLTTLPTVVLRNGNTTNMKTRIMNTPPDSIRSITSLTESGANAYSKRDPSSGGNGIILNTKKLKLTRIKILAMLKVSVPMAIPANFANSAAIKASRKLENGPAKPTIATPNSLCRTLLGLNGTGRAIKNGGKCKRTSATGNSTDVIKSMCFIGLSVRRPSS